MIKILVITHDINNKSGWGRYSSSILKEYLKFGLVYKVVTEKGSNQSNELNILSPTISVFKLISNIFKVRKLAKDFDIIHAFDGWPYAVYGYFSSLGRNKKLFISGVGTYSVDPFNFKCKKWLMKKAFIRAEKIFCISDYTKKKISEKLKPSNLLTVLLGATRLNLLSDEEVSKFKIEYKLKDHYPVFLTVGAIKSRKGQYYSLQAITQLKSKYPDFRYFIIGSDADKKYVDKIKKYCHNNKISDNVIIINKASDKVLSFFYQRSDVFIMTSVNNGDYFEGFGLVFLEAATFGLPVIGSKNCGIEDALQNGYNGYLAEQRQPNDIYDKIIKVLASDQEQWKHHSQEFASRFSWYKTVSKYYE